jgi:gamma-glutamylcyclotransferase (GGCT)/AIG2-like uncharacterized protein YtfP
LPFTPDRLVVYGSLMRDLPSATGERGPDLLDRLGVGALLRRVGPCRVGGVLFDLGAYPALRRSPCDADSVCGELYTILDPAVLAVLDDFEGYDPRNPSDSDYLRERVELLEPRGVDAWVYVFNREPDPILRIASGDWRAHLANHRRTPHDPDSSNTV